MKLFANHPSNHRFDKISKSIIKIIRDNFLKFAIKVKLKITKKFTLNETIQKLNLKGDLFKYKDKRILINNNEIKNYLKKGLKNF